MREEMRSPRLSRWPKIGAAALLGMGLGLIGLAPSAQAARVTGGQSAISVDRNLVKKLSNSAVKVGNVKPATKRRNTVRLRFRRGDFMVETNNPAPLEPMAILNISGQGALRGGLDFTRRARGGKRSVKVKNLRVDLEERRVTARIGRRNVVLFSINMGWATPAGASAQRPRLLSAPLKLTPAGAKLINRGLGRRVLRKNSGFGKLTVAPVLASS